MTRTALVLQLTLSTCMAFAQPADPSPDADTTILDRATTVFGFRHEDREGVEIVRVDEPLLRWTNPIRKTPGGAVYLWTSEGRPAVAMCVYTYSEQGLDWEIQSLLPSRVTGVREGRDVWTPKTPGVTFAPVPDAPAPAATEKLRLIQMRGLSRLFGATIGAEGKNQRKVRRLTQPLHRYGDPDGEVVDGAMFGFVMGTDPEVLLLLEARRNGDELRWEYALGRMTGSVCTATLSGKEVWSVPVWPWRPDPRLPYITFVGRRSEVPAPAKETP